MKHNKTIGLFLICLGLPLALSACDMSFMNVESNDNKETVEIMSYEDWLKSKDATDYNSDGMIDSQDYVEYVAFTKWKESKDANDLNGDKKITYDDYLLTKSGTKSEYETWLDSNEKEDYNHDNKIDEEDYRLYKTFGTYQISNFIGTGVDYTLVEGESFTLFELSSYLGESTVVVSKNGVAISYGAESTLSQSVKTLIGSVFSTIKLSYRTSSMMTLSFTVNTTAGEADLVFYLIPESETSFTTSSTFTIGNMTTSVSFKVTKIQ